MKIYHPPSSSAADQEPVSQHTDYPKASASGIGNIKKGAPSVATEQLNPAFVLQSLSEKLNVPPPSPLCKNMDEFTTQLSELLYKSQTKTGDLKEALTSLSESNDWASTILKKESLRLYFGATNFPLKYSALAEAVAKRIAKVISSEPQSISERKVQATTTPKKIKNLTAQTPKVETTGFETSKTPLDNKKAQTNTTPKITSETRTSPVAKEYTDTSDKTTTQPPTDSADDAQQNKPSIQSLVTGLWSALSKHNEQLLPKPVVSNSGDTKAVIDGLLYELGPTIGELKVGLEALAKQHSWAGACLVDDNMKKHLQAEHLSVRDMAWTLAEIITEYMNGKSAQATYNPKRASDTQNKETPTQENPETSESASFGTHADSRYKNTTSQDSDKPTTQPPTDSANDAQQNKPSIQSLVTGLWSALRKHNEQLPEPVVSNSGDTTDVIEDLLNDSGSTIGQLKDGLKTIAGQHSWANACLADNNMKKHFKAANTSVRLMSLTFAEIITEYMNGKSAQATYNPKRASDTQNKETPTKEKPKNYRSAPFGAHADSRYKNTTSQGGDNQKSSNPSSESSWSKSKSFNGATPKSNNFDRSHSSFSREKSSYGYSSSNSHRNDDSDFSSDFDDSDFFSSEEPSYGYFSSNSHRNDGAFDDSDFFSDFDDSNFFSSEEPSYGYFSSNSHRKGGAYNDSNFSYREKSSYGYSSSNSRRKDTEKPKKTDNKPIIKTKNDKINEALSYVNNNNINSVKNALRYLQIDVSKKASVKLINSQFKALARIYHPDKLSIFPGVNLDPLQGTDRTKELEAQRTQGAEYFKFLKRARDLALDNKSS